MPPIERGQPFVPLPPVGTLRGFAAPHHFNVHVEDRLLTIALLLAQQQLLARANEFWPLPPSCPAAHRSNVTRTRVRLMWKFRPPHRGEDWATCGSQQTRGFVLRSNQVLRS